MSELKAGESRKFEVGGKQLVIEAVPYGNIKKILKVVAEVAGAFKSSDDALTQISGSIEKHLPDFLPLLFRKGTVDYMTSEWIDENLTLAQLREIIQAAVAVNGLQDFFGKQGAKAAPVTAQETKPSSTTSSDSPTAGDPTK